MNHNNILILISLVSLVSCAAPIQSPYQPQKSKQGYSVTKINSTSYRILFRGNSITSPQRVADFALLRAAELTINNGYHYLRVISYLSKYIEEQVNISNPVLVQETHTAYTYKNVEYCEINNNRIKRKVVYLNNQNNAVMQVNHDLYQKNTYSTSNWQLESQNIIFKIPTSEVHIDFINKLNKSNHNVLNASEIIKKITKKYQLKLNLKNNFNSI